MDPSALPGPLKVAILVQTLGEEPLQGVLSKLSATERSEISRYCSEMGVVPKELAEAVTMEFTNLIDRKEKSRTGPEGSRADRDPESSQIPGIRKLQSLEPGQLLELFGNEHPQTLAAIVMHLRTELGGKVLAGLSEEIRADVALRIATLGKIPTVVIEQIGEMVEDVVRRRERPTSDFQGGVRTLAELLNKVDRETGKSILAEISTSDPEMAQQVEREMFVFEDIVLVDDQGLQKVLRRLETRELAVALKATSETVREKIFRNMSERAAEILREEIEAVGAVRMKEVEDARRNVTTIVAELEANGDLIIAGRGGDELVA